MSSIATKINRIGIKIAAPPVDGKANKELLKYLSEVLGIRKSALEIVEVIQLYYFYFTKSDLHLTFEV